MPAKLPHTVSITVLAESEQDAQVRKAALESIANNLTTANLQVLAEKSRKPGINEKIQQFKFLI